jgi:hypothetical protein
LRLYRYARLRVKFRRNFGFRGPFRSEKKLPGSKATLSPGRIGKAIKNFLVGISGAPGLSICASFYPFKHRFMHFPLGFY